MSSAAGAPPEGGGDRPWQSYHTAYTNAKAGMEGVDKEKVQKVIYEMSKGSKYFENEQRKEAATKQKIEHLRALCATLTGNDMSHFQKVAEKKMLELEASRDLSKIWLHTDMDAFYAAVETLENPSLKGKPLAVGSMSMIATASYEARKFGVRAAMPGFIGCKLCPGLALVPPNFERYTHYSELTRKVFQRYDPNFIATSLDEAYLNITNICIERGITGEEVATELRAAIHQETGLTCSAGVAPNRMIAKVCSDINKPNGQFILPNDREAVLTFVSTLPIRKIGGIGKVTEHMLRQVLGISTCQEMLQKAAFLCALFSEGSADFFLSVGLGLGGTETPVSPFHPQLFQVLHVNHRRAGASSRSGETVVMHSGIHARPVFLLTLAGASPAPSSGRRVPWPRSGLGAVLRRPKGPRHLPLAAGDLCNRAHREKLHVAVLVSKSTLQDDHGASLQGDYVVSEGVKAAGFRISANELASIVESRDTKKLTMHGQLHGIADKLVTSLTDGISTDEYSLNQRQDMYGVNKFTESEVRSLWEFVWEALQDTTLIILIACALVSFVVGIATEGWPNGAHDGIGIFTSILLVVSVTATSNYQQSLQFRDLDKEKRKIYVQVTRNGLRQRILIDDLLSGDVVHLAVGDQVPADGLFISGYSVLINESSLTGESEPVVVNEDNPFILSGTKVLDGSCKMLLTAVGMQTQWGKLMASITESGHDETPLQVKLNGVANTIGNIGLLFALLTFVVLSQGLVGQKYHDGLLLSWSGEDALEILEHFAIAVTIVVVAVPEGLPLAVTLSLAFAMKKMMNDKALVRQLAACETMGSATIICSDKTGTLTTNRMSVVKACICGNTIDVTNPSIPSNSSTKLPEVALQILLESIFNNTAGEVVNNQDGECQILGTPTEAALLDFALSMGGNFKEKRQETKIVKVEPFNSTKKRMSVILELPEGRYRAHCKGASELVLAACDKFIDSSGNIVALDKTTTNKFNDIIKTFSKEALRTLCLAYREMDDDDGFSIDEKIPLQGYTCIGIVGIKDPVRPGVRQSVATCRSAGITVRMVTGDNINTAKAIARECGILTEDGIAIEGAEFREKSPEELLELIPKMQVLARSSPLDKHTLVKHLRTTFNEVVAVTGDGTNDAPALREADIGLAMGIAGTEVAKESADVVILDDNFSTIVTVAKWGRSVYVNIQKFVQFQLTVNVVALLVNFSSACFIGDAPLTAVQLLWVNMIMDTLGALALATEPPDDNLMKKAPVGRMGKFITNVMWRNILGQSVFQFAAIWYLQTQGKYLFGLEGSEADTILNTIIFNTFVFCQVFNEISSRDMEEVNVTKGLPHNSIFVGILSGTIIFQFILVQFLGDFANTTPLTQLQWLVSVLFGLLGMPIAAAIKLIPVEPHAGDGQTS